MIRPTMNLRLIPTALSTLVGIGATGCLQAQPAIGSSAPSIELKKTFNGALSSLEEMRGCVVLLDYFATW